MKVLYLIIIALITAQSIHAQSEAKANIDLDIRLGYTIPSEGNTNPGLSIGLEPRIWLVDVFSLGLKLDVHQFSSDLADASINAHHSLALMLDYYTNNEKKDQLFIGVGTGLFRDGGYSSIFVSESVSNINHGLTGRVGYLHDQIRIGFEYNYILDNSTFDYYGVYFSWNPF